MLTHDASTSLQNTVLSLFHGVDALHWEGVLGALAPEVTTDYTSLFGGSPVTQPAEALVAAWRGLLPGFDATQHLLGPLQVDGTDEAATVRCQVRGYHRLGAETWMVAGRYTMHLLRTDGVWRVCHLTLHTAYQEGNPGLVAQAAARAADSPRA